MSHCCCAVVVLCLLCDAALIAVIATDGYDVVDLLLCHGDDVWPYAGFDLSKKTKKQTEGGY